MTIFLSHTYARHTRGPSHKKSEQDTTRLNSGRVEHNQFFKWSYSLKKMPWQYLDEPTWLSIPRSSVSIFCNFGPFRTGRISLDLSMSPKNRPHFHWKGSIIDQSRPHLHENRPHFQWNSLFNQCVLIALLLPVVFQLRLSNFHGSVIDYTPLSCQQS